MSLSFRLRCLTTTSGRLQKHAMSASFFLRSLVSKPPGSNPLDILRMECAARSLCNEDGRHLPGTHWVVALALANADPTKPPNLRTVGIAQLGPLGIDFVVKRGSATADRLDHYPVSILHQHGRFLPGECAEQWRGEGVCCPIRLDEIIDCVPLHTVTSIMASSLVAAENETASDSFDNDSSIVQPSTGSSGRRVMENKSHLTEVMQTIHHTLRQNDTIPVDVLEPYLAAYRFQPYRMECMTGGPDTVMWDRWEWVRRPNDNSPPNEPLEWDEPKPLMPH